jgi:metallo-beta-lactamase superfamily protein
MPAPKKSEETLDTKTIRVRMYRIGFGDCFLLSFPLTNTKKGADTHAHVLVDCGVHPSGRIGTMDAVVDNIAKVTGNKLSIVIASHAHADHISGFDTCADKFGSFDVGEVWLPWTWNPKDKEASKLQKKHEALATALAEHLAAAPKSKAKTAIENLDGNAHAIALLNNGLGAKGKVKYLTAGDDLQNTPIPNLSARILGPPRSVEFLGKMDPPASQHYLRLADGGASRPPIRPFQPKWLAARDSAEMAGLALTSEEESELETSLGSSFEDLAFSLDQAKNNESVVALFVFRGQYLLFPGDAQYGNWLWWLDNESPEEILPRITFFKVAHHGSVNATPKRAVEAMSTGKFAAMVSTQSSPWPSIPRIPLMERLDEKTKQRTVRSDWIEVEGAPDPSPETAPPKPQNLPKGFRSGPLWIDYLIPC